MLCVFFLGGWESVGISNRSGLVLVKRGCACPAYCYETLCFHVGCPWSTPQPGKRRGSDNKFGGLPAVDCAGVYFDFDFGSGSTSARRSRKEAGNRSRKKTPRYWKARWPDVVGSAFGGLGSSAPGGLEPRKNGSGFHFCAAQGPQVPSCPAHRKPTQKHPATMPSSTHGHPRVPKSVAMLAHGEEHG